MSTSLHRWEEFIARLEQAVEQGDPELVAGNMPRLEKIIARLMDEQPRLATLQYGARKVRDQHEPSA